MLPFKESLLSTHPQVLSRWPLWNEMKNVSQLFTNAAEVTKRQILPTINRVRSAGHRRISLIANEDTRIVK